MKKFAILLVCLFLFSNVYTQSPKIFGNKSKKIYYVGECGEIYNITDTNLVYFDTEKEALDKGFKKTEQCTILEDPKEKELVFAFFGHKETKIFHPTYCNEAKIMEPLQIAGFKTKDDAIKAGYKEGKCTAPKAGQVKSSGTVRSVKIVSLSSIVNRPDDYYGKIFYIDGYIKGKINIPIASTCFNTARDVARITTFKIGNVYDDSNNDGYFFLLVGDRDAPVLARKIDTNKGYAVRGVLKVLFSQKLENDCFGLELLGYQLD